MIINHSHHKLLSSFGRHFPLTHCSLLLHSSFVLHPSSLLSTQFPELHSCPVSHSLSNLHSSVVVVLNPLSSQELQNPPQSTCSSHPSIRSLLQKVFLSSSLNIRNTPINNIRLFCIPR